MLWHRTSPRPLVPFGDQAIVSAGNPPLNVSGMTLVAVDASGRLAELISVPEPFDSGTPRTATNWSPLFEAAGLQMSIRRFSPDSLIGWTRLISGRWRDPHVGRDVLIGISAGLAMTVLYAAHNFIPPLFGRPEPMPAWNDTAIFMGTRYVLSNIVGLLSSALTNSMLAVVGIVALLMLLKRTWLAWLAGSAIFVWVVIQGTFPAGTPILDLVIGFGIIAIYIGVILRWGLLATIAALFTHFLLLVAPLTTDLNSWRATASLTYTAVLAGVGLLGAWLARHNTVELVNR